MSVNAWQTCGNNMTKPELVLVKKPEPPQNDVNLNSAVQRPQVPQERLNFNVTSTAVISKFANGFQTMDLIQDIINTKLNSFSHQNSISKHEKIRSMIENAIGETERNRVQEIFSQVTQFKTEEKLLLYLKLPLCLSNANGAADPLRQPLNPLGNRTEIHQTIQWIKTHLKEDPGVSLPKQEVYDEYNLFCAKNSMKPLSTADFGKVMKQVYPRVKPRRLGTRGNSRYCYAGMRKNLKLEVPRLPEDEALGDNTSEELLGAASTLIREWAQNVLNMKFPTLASLAKYLVSNLYVDAQSLAAVSILSSSREPELLPDNLGSNVLPGAVKPSMDSSAQNHCKGKSPSSAKRGKKGNIKSESTNSPGNAVSDGCQESTKTKKTHCGISPQPNCDNNPRPRSETKIPRKRSTANNSSSNNTPSLTPPSDSSPEKQFKLIENSGNSNLSLAPGTVRIFASDLNLFKTDNNTSITCDIKTECKAPPLLYKSQILPSRSITEVDRETLNEYLNGNNSQEQEEELLQYFQQHNDPKKENLNTKSQSIKLTQPLHSALLNVKRRVSFESNVIGHKPGIPQSPNTRRRIFNFTPISPSPFASPRNTPVPRSRSSRAISRSISCNVPRPPQDASGDLSCPMFDADVPTPLVISYPSQENLQEIKNSAYNSELPSSCRSRSVPLHQMVNPALLSPITPSSAGSFVDNTPVPSEFNDFGENSASAYLEDLLDSKVLLDILDEKANHESPSSYPNTPVPVVSYSYQPEDSNGGSTRSYPTTPIVDLGYSQSKEPMLFSPAVNGLNRVEVSELLNPEFPRYPEGDNDDLNTLSQYEALTPLFNEVVE